MLIDLRARAHITDPPHDADFKHLLRTKLRVVNPEYVAVARFGSRFAKKPPQWIYGFSYDEASGVLTLPRNFALRQFCTAKFVDHTVSVPGEFPKPKAALYDYQEAAADAVFALVNSNDAQGLPTDTMVVMATSSGKTVLGMFLGWHSGERTLIVVPTKEVEEAWISDCHKFFGLSSKEIGRIRGKKISIGKHFTVGSIQTLMRLDPAAWADQFGFVIYDECFPGGVLVDGRPISAYSVGDTVTAVSETGVVTARVTKVFSRHASSLVVVTAGVASVPCTPGHPWLTNRGWMRAVDLLDGGIGCPHESNNEGKSPHRRVLQGLRDLFQDMGLQGAVPTQKEGLFVLRARLLTESRGDTAHAAQQDHPARRNAAGQPYAEGACALEGIENVENDGPQASYSRRERLPDPCASQDAAGCISKRGSGVSSKLWIRVEEERAPNTLQAGFGISCNNGCGGGGRFFALFVRETAAGPKEGCLLEWVRVDSVEVAKQGDSGRFEQVCPDGKVYNLHVEGPETYIADGFVVHNCHRLPGKSFIKVLENSNAHIRVGLTATDVRKDGMMPAVRWHLGADAFKDTKPRNSVPLIYKGVLTDATFPPTSVQGGEIIYEWQDVLAKIERSTIYNKVVLRVIREAEKIGGKILVVSCRVEHLNRLRFLMARERGEQWVADNTMVITGKLTGKNRETSYADVKAGRFLVTFATQSIMAEGASVPCWWHVIVATPFSDPKIAVQLKGRPIRRDPSDPRKTQGYYWDIIANIRMLRNMARTRYRAIVPHAQKMEMLEHTCGRDTLVPSASIAPRVSRRDL